MLKFLSKFFSKNFKNQINPTKKLFLTLFLLFLLRFGNTIPLMGIDQEALKKSFFQIENKNSILQILNMYAGGGGITLLSPFSLGIIPFINSSILLDLFTAIFPFLEKLQSEEGEMGKKKLNFYKKLATICFAILQAIFLISYLKPFFYDTTFSSYLITGIELITSSLFLVWISSIIDTKGIGNGTSIIIFTNIIVTLISKNILLLENVNSTFFLEIFILLILMIFICLSQTTRINIDVVSARQLAYLENNKKLKLRENNRGEFENKESGLSIRLNQAGIFPIIIASNIFPFLASLSPIFGSETKVIPNLVYYLLIIGFNYFYTTVFWDPEKISEQLRKASVSIVNITPGKETILYLEKVVQSTSILGGIFLCCILITYDFLKEIIHGSLLSQINISSLIILVGVAYEIQKNLRNSYRNTTETSK